MKVLQINPFCGVGSTGRICTDIAELLEREGHECKIAYGRDAVPAQFQKYAVRVGSFSDLLFHGAKARLFDAMGFGSRRATKRLIKWIKSYDPDVVHLHNVHSYFLNIELLFEYLADAKKPVIWTLHDCWGFTGHCTHFDLAGCRKWQESEGCRKCPLRREYPKSLFLDASARNFKKKKMLTDALEGMIVVTPSEWLCNAAKESFLGRHEVLVIPNGVDLNAFSPTESDFRARMGLEQKKIVLGVATSWGENKGLSEFLALADRLGEDYQVVLLGMSEQQIAALPQNVLGLPRTDSVRELAEIYTAADVFVNAGKQETMGLTTVEAMACGTPVVASNRTAVPEVVRPEGGVVVDELTVEQLALCVERVIESPPTDPRANAGLYEKVAQYRKYISLYQKAVDGREGENQA